MEEFVLVFCLPGAEEDVYTGTFNELLEFARIFTTNTSWEIYRKSDEVIFAESYGKLISDYSIEHIQ